MSNEIKINYRDYENCDSNRSLLYNASEVDITDYTEKIYLQQYKQIVDQIKSKQVKLSEIRKKLRDLSLDEENKDSVEYKNLQAFAVRVANSINKLDRELINLKRTVPLQRVLEREKQKAMEKEREDGKKILEEYRNIERKKQEELLKRYQERVEAKKKEKQLSEKPKQKKSKIKKLLKNLRAEREGFFSILWYVSLVLWFGFVGRIIIVSEMHIILKILMIIGCLWWGFYVFVLHYNLSEED